MDRDLDKLQCLLDYHLNLDDPTQRQRTEQLLEVDQQAQSLNAALRTMLAPLADLPEVSPPAGLADRTIAFVERRSQALTMERASDAVDARRAESGNRRERSRWVLGSLRDMIAVAASILLVVMVSQPGLRYARQQAQRIACASQLADTGLAFAGYAADNNGFLPYKSRQPGARWFVGEKGSNTRNAFMLIKGDYVPARAFVCPAVPGRTQVRIKIDPKTLKTMVDFSTRRAVSYSTRLTADGDRIDSLASSVLMADQNPLFAAPHGQRAGELDLAHNHELATSNSPNHRGTGQNVLHGAGDVHFRRNRYAGIGQDDIYTINAVTRYRGTEVPQSQADIFTAP